ncbi:tetratricopeptide repeat protein [bacterium]|nr:tetratricopeptide repeat protein [candidate division CSSED10-310 bacterium]
MAVRSFLRSRTCWAWVFFAAEWCICSQLCLSAGPEKPRLEISEVVIETNTPALSGGKKDPITVLDTQTATASVSDTLRRLPADAPDQILIPEEPLMESKGGCLTPFARFGGGAKSRMIRASRAWEAMDWQEVIDQLTPVVNHDQSIQEKPEALYFIGRSRHYLNDFSGAQTAYEQLRVEYPEHPYTEFALYSLGWLYFENRQPDQALSVISDFETHFAASALTPYIRYLRAAILNIQNKYPDALHDLEGIIAGYPLFSDIDDVQFWIAENQFSMGRFEDACRNYTLYIGNYPDGNKQVEALYGRAFCYLEMKKFESALNDFRTIVRDHPEHPLSGEAGFQGGKLAVFLVFSGEVEGFFTKALLTYRVDSPKKYEAQAWIAYQGGRFGESATEFARAAEGYAAEDPEALPMNPHRAEMLFLEAVSLLRAGDYVAAAEKFDFLARIPDLSWTAAAQANAGIACLKLNKLDLALEHLTNAIRSPQSLAGRDLYSLYAAEIQFRFKRFDESLQLFSELANQHDDEEIRMESVRGIAWNYYAMQKWEDAARFFTTLIEQFPDTRFQAEALLRRAECRFNSGDYEPAKMDFQHLISAFPLHPEAFEARLLNARADWIRGDYREGMDGLRDALRFAPDAAHRQRVRSTLGELYQEQGRFQEAVDEFHQAYLEDISGPGAPLALVRKADNLYNLGEYEKSAEVYRCIIRDYPETDSAELAQYSIGLIYFRQDRLDEYLKECRSIAATHPGSIQSALALNGAASILTEQKRFSEAADILQVLRDQYSGHLDQELIRFRLGQCLEQAGLSDDAKRELDDLIELAPTGRYAADATLLLGEMAMRRNAVAEAAVLFENVIELFPFHPRRLDAIALAANANTVMRNWSRAETLWIRFIDEAGVSGDVFRAHLELGRLLSQQGHFEQAAVHAEAAIRSSERPVIAAARLLENEIKENQGDSQEALKGYLKIGYLFPEQNAVVFESQVAAVRILIDQGKKGQAGNLLEKAQENAITPEQQQRMTVLRHELEQAGGSE